MTTAVLWADIKSFGPDQLTQTLSRPNFLAVLLVREGAQDGQDVDAKVAGVKESIWQAVLDLSPTQRQQLYGTLGVIEALIWEEGANKGTGKIVKPGQARTNYIWNEILGMPQDQQAAVLSTNNVVTSFTRTDKLDTLWDLISKMPPELQRQILLNNNNHAVAGLRNRSKGAEVDAMMADLQRPARPTVRTDTVLALAASGNQGNTGL